MTKTKSLLMDVGDGLPKELTKFRQEIIDLDSVIQLPAIKTKGGKKLGQSFWVTVKSTSGSVEGKLHFSLESLDRLIISEPGCPGDGSSRLERLHLNSLLRNGYDVFATRHNGTIINGKYSHIYLNCPQRQEKAQKEGQDILGDRKLYTIADWLKEPRIALEAFSPFYKEIYLVGHSSGPLAILSSLIDFFTKEHPKYINDRIKRFVSLAGTTGRIREEKDPILIQWLDYFYRGYNGTMRERIKIGDPKDNFEILKKTYFKIREKGKYIPQSIELIFISPWGDTKDSIDEGVNPVEVVDIITTLGRGFLIIDKTQRADKQTGRLAHDMDNLKSSTLLKFLDKNWLPSQQISVIQ